ncbi:glycosyltransferase family 4 protein [Pseudopedobacter beijingensis]|uniref:Glycosyltransferase family 4 protein n=1 Tax=Pseudopedobacter beijingensis TaxID=1207056 RepID=A0ABW4I7A4_9SPHI
MNKLAIISTHPIQYYAPVYKLLATECTIKVFYTWGTAALKPKHDPGFGQTIAWDIPLLEGYEYEFLDNKAKNPGSHHRKGIINSGIIQRIEEFAPDTLLVYGYAYHSHFKAMQYFKDKIPVWFRGDSTLLDHGGALKSILKSIYLKWVYQYVDKAFYVGNNNKAYFKKYGLKEEQLVFAPHAIDNNRFGENRNEEALQLRKQLGVLPDDSLILFAGKLEPKKNPELLIEAFIQLVKKNETDFSTKFEMTNRKVHLLFVGNGVLEKSLMLKAKNFNDEIASSLAMTNRVHFIDFQNQSQMPVVYQACNIFCLPSQGPGETWGLAINEAMAAGKAILASDKVGCAADLVQNEVNGFIFKSGDQVDLQEKLKCLLKTNLVEYGKSSKKIIENWSFEKQIKALTKELKKC